MKKLNINTKTFHLRYLINCEKIQFNDIFDEVRFENFNF